MKKEPTRMGGKRLRHLSTIFIIHNVSDVSVGRPAFFDLECVVPLPFFKNLYPIGDVKKRVTRGGGVKLASFGRERRKSERRELLWERNGRMDGMLMVRLLLMMMMQL
jgi:hypothetical protein